MGREVCDVKHKGSFSAWNKNPQCQNNCKYLFTRECIFPECDPNVPRLKYSGECSGGKCKKPKWQQWSEWSDCDEGNFNFIKSRWRECLRGGIEFADGECDGNEFEMKACENDKFKLGKVFEFLAKQ